jgi:murein DD-endopeptidase MepM/ murein hydrolase activator NlpD
MTRALLVLALLLPLTLRAQDLSTNDQALLERLVLAEAQGEGTLGMALVARSVLNRSALVQSGKIGAGTYMARSGSLHDVIHGRYQYEPVSSGSINRTRSATERRLASEAIALARDTPALRAALSKEGLSAASIDRLLSASGFRTKNAYNDPSQNFDRATFRNHVFNADSFSRRHDVPGLFAKRFEHPSTARPKSTSGIVGALRGAPTEPTQALTHEVRPGDTLHSIAAQHGTSVAKLKELNGTSSLLQPGQELRLPTPPAAPSTSSAPSASDQPESLPLAELYAEAKGLEAKGQGERALEPLRQAVFKSMFRDARARYELARLYDRLAAKAPDPEQAASYRNLAGGHLRGASEANPGHAPENARWSKAAKAYLTERDATQAAKASTHDAWRRGKRLGPIRVVTLDGKPVATSTAQAFKRMRAAAAADGVQLQIVSGFRSYREQEDLYRLYQQGRGNLAARPGYSNHQDGKALDLDTSRPGALTWLERNARRFGFLRTVPSEDWHWEYWPR